MLRAVSGEIRPKNFGFLLSFTGALIFEIIVRLVEDGLVTVSVAAFMGVIKRFNVLDRGGIFQVWPGLDRTRPMHPFGAGLNVSVTFEMVCWNVNAV
jgi:hypothetical protein